MYENTDYNINYNNGGLFNSYPDPEIPGVQFYIDVKTAFLNYSDNSKYSNYFTAFNFGDLAVLKGNDGAVQNVSVRNLALFPISLTKPTGEYTLGHEGLHGLGLRHTHRDGSSGPYSVITPIQKNIFPNYNSITDKDNATDNVMSYNPIKLTLWKWQWAIIKNLFDL